MSWTLVVVPIIAVILLNLPFGEGYRKLAFPAGIFLAVLQSALVLLPIENMFPYGACPLSPFVFLSPDALGLLMILSVGIVVFSALLVGWRMTDKTSRKSDFANLIILAMAGMNGVILSGDLFSLYVFLEIVAVSSFILIAMDKNREALEGSFKYIMLSAVATILILSSISVFLMLTGSTSFSAAAAALKQGNHAAVLASGLFIIGLLIKGGIAPFHGWLPDAYTSAPAGVSIFLAGIVTKTTGIYTIIKLVSYVTGYTGPVKEILLFFGAVSALLGAFAALDQKNFKRMLAYSSISQMGYVIMGLGAGNPLGVMGAAFHLFNHAIFKTQLFVNSAAVEQETGTLNMDRLGGLSDKMPVTGATSVVALLSTAGVPPLSGFWSKLLVIVALWVAGYKIYALIAVFAGVVTLAYLLSMQRRVFFGNISASFSNIKEAGVSFTLPAVLLSTITIAAGVFFPYVFEKLIIPVQALLGLL
ncbi:MAG: hypothetical protein JW803_06470 [Endomicrobiales bacterium]|nr:hypothetical protein [Endomicrobiales bacterium]